MNGPWYFRRRRSVRSENHNYRWTARYFVTIRAKLHEPVFDIPELRAIIEQEWYALPTRFPNVDLDEFIIMPDHVHFILGFNMTSTQGPLIGTSRGSIQIIDHCCMVQIPQSARHVLAWAAVATKLPRGYHDHIIRDQAELEQKRQYIRDNPIRWKEKHPHDYE